MIAEMIGVTWISLIIIYMMCLVIMNYGVFFRDISFAHRILLHRKWVRFILNMIYFFVRRRIYQVYISTDKDQFGKSGYIKWVVERRDVNKVLKFCREHYLKDSPEHHDIYEICTDKRGRSLPQPVFDYFNGIY